MLVADPPEVLVTGVTWTSRQERWQVPPAPLHPVPSVHVHLAGSVEMHVVTVLWQGDVGRFARAWAHRRGLATRVTCVLRPAGDEEDAVDLQAAGLGARVRSARVRRDPRASVVVDVRPGDVLAAGEPCQVLHLPDAGVSLEVLAVPATGTVTSHGRWRLRDPERVAGGPYAFLATGRVAGETCRSGTGDRPPGGGLVRPR